MVSKEEFWIIMDGYGSQIWPIQLVFYFTAILLLGWLLIKPGRFSSLAIKLFLAITFVWNGIMFFMVFAKGIAGNSRGNYVFALLFILVAVLLFIDLFKNRMLFSLPIVKWQKYITLFLMVLVFCYPIVGMLSGHSRNSLIMPGAFPCPTTALALLVLTMALPQADKLVYLMLIFFAVPFTPFFQIARYGVYEDVILLTTGVYSLVLLVIYWKRKSAFA